jgi:hypothetical protein
MSYDDLRILKKVNDFEFCTQSATSSPLLCTKTLISICEQTNQLNKLYTRKFSRIPIFDEDEDSMVTPDKPNGYQFTLELSKLYNFILFGSNSVNSS